MKFNKYFPFHEKYVNINVIKERCGVSMNIPELSTALANMELSEKVGIAVLSKALDSVEVSGDTLVQMMDRSMELSVNPAIGSNIDIMV